MTDQPRIFVSYARSDGEGFAKELRRRLIEDHQFSLWQDQADMEGGKDWWQQIVDAIKEIEYLVLVMTPASMLSDMVRKEWRLARQEGVCVIPVIGTRGLKIEGLPRWMRDVHFVDPDVPEQWTRFIHTLESPCQAARVPFMVEELPEDFVPRSREYEQLIACLFDERREEPVAITAALRGAGGYGKTTLAKAVCHDERLQEAFHDGILWITMGQEPNIIGALTKVYAALTADRPHFVDIEDAANALAGIWGDRDCLLVIDDVWNPAHLSPFLRGGKHCARLITTRDSTTIPESATKVKLDAMQDSEALALLRAGLPDEEHKFFRELAARLGEWPLLLKLVNGALRVRVDNMHQSLAAALAFVNKALDKRGLTAFDARNAVERQQAVAKVIGASFEHLTEDEQSRYQELAIFPEDVDLPIDTVGKLWGATGTLDELDTEELCVRLDQLSLLLRCDLTTRRISLHDVMRTYMQQRQDEKLTFIHGKFLDSYGLRDWSSLPTHESYLWCYLAYHLMEAGRQDELRETLLNFAWIQGRLKQANVTDLLFDYDYDPKNLDLILASCAIRLAAHVLASDKTQLAGQLLGRLPLDASPAIQQLRNQAGQWRGASWLRPLIPTLTPPGGPLVRTLRGHTGAVWAVTVTPDGRSAISASEDRTLKVWELCTGNLIATFNGDGAIMSCAAVLDGRTIVAGEATGSVHFLRLEGV